MTTETEHARELAAHVRREGQRAVKDAHQQMIDHRGDIVRAYVQTPNDIDESDAYLIDVRETLWSWMDSSQKYNADFELWSARPFEEDAIVRRLGRVAAVTALTRAAV